jgi:T-complex protein 1 subunit eta
MAAEIWEPALNKANSIYAACEAACVILKIDETVRNPRSQDPGAADKSGVSLQQQQQRTSAAMGGRGMAGMMGRGGRGVRRLK